LITANAKCTWGSVNIEEMSSENYFMWRITGDAFKVKSGYRYKVWGASSDPMTWRQQNISVEGGQIR
jgi:hypothetical protein